MQCLTLDAPAFIADFTVAEGRENKTLGSPILLSILEIPFEKFFWKKDLIEGHWHIKYEESLLNTLLTVIKFNLVS